MPPKINGQDVSAIKSRVVNKVNRKCWEQIGQFGLENKIEELSRKLQSADCEIKKLQSENKQIIKVSQELFVLVQGIVNVTGGNIFCRMSIYRYD